MWMHSGIARVGQVFVDHENPEAGIGNCVDTPASSGEIAGVMFQIDVRSRIRPLPKF